MWEFKGVHDRTQLFVGRQSVPTADDLDWKVHLLCGRTSGIEVPPTTILTLNDDHYHIDEIIARMP